MRPQVVEMPALQEDANGVFEDQTTAGADTIALDGDLQTVNNAQKLSVEGAGDNSAVNMTVVGTDADGNPGAGETFLLAAAGTATTNGHYTNFSSITVDAAITGNIEGGWLRAQGAVSKSTRLNSKENSFNVGVGIVIPAALTQTLLIESSIDAPEDVYANGYSNTAEWNSITGLTAVSSDTSGNTTNPTQCIRTRVTGDTDGTNKVTYLQAR